MPRGPAPEEGAGPRRSGTPPSYTRPSYTSTPQRDAAAAMARYFTMKG